MDLYFVLVIPALIFALWAQFKVKSAYNKYADVPSSEGLSGAEAARRILDANGLQNVPIEIIGGTLSDNYDPRDRVLHLSQDVYYSRSVAAVGVAAHECGHALQDLDGYAPLRFRMAIIPVTQFGSNLAFPLFFLGILFSWAPLMSAGILLYALVALFQAITLPVEFDASRRAVEVLSGYGMIDSNDEYGVRKVLTAAALTYVAALATALANLLRLMAIAGGGRGRRR